MENKGWQLKDDGSEREIEKIKKTLKLSGKGKWMGKNHH